MIERPMFFAGNPIYRASNERRDPDWIEQALKADSSCFLPVSQLEFPATNGAQGQLLWGDRNWMKISAKPEEPIFLGEFKGRAHFAFDQNLDVDVACRASCFSWLKKGGV